MLACSDAPPAAPTVQPLKLIRRWPAAEAKQGVAVDSRYFYAIDDAAIGKYEKASGARAGGWKAASDDRITHLDSGVVVDGRLYSAHSNYPDTPMVSSVEVFDVERMSHVQHIPLPAVGSATWIDPKDGSWWVTFGHYAGIGAEPGKGPADTTIVEFDDQWRERRRWSFPAEVVRRWSGMSSSGGVWVGDVLYTTGHHARELYVLAPPTTGSVLALRTIVPFESEGQGIAVDRAARQLYSIQRRTREVLVSELPDNP
jgi:hypothetical protein